MTEVASSSETSADIYHLHTLMTETVSSSETTDNIYETAHADGGIKLS
jgi:hypothetical protein